MDDDEIFNSVLGPAQSPGAPRQVAQAPAVASTEPQSDDEIFDSVLGGAPTPGLIKQEPQLDTRTGTDAKPGSPENPLQAVVSFSRALAEARQIGQYGFRESAMGHAVKNGQLTLEEAEKQMADDDSIAIAQGDLKAYEDDVWRQGSWIAGIPTSVAIGTAKQLPMLEEVLKVTGLGAAAGGGAALATGAGAPFAVPVAGATGTALAAGWTTDLIVGQEYLKRRRQGVPHDIALATSSISGIVQGVMSGFQFGQIAKLPLDAAKNILKGHAATMVNFLAEGVKFGTIQLSLAEAQTATRLMFDAIAGTVGKVPDAIPTMKQATDEFLETFNETLKGATGMYLGGKGLGWSAGKVLKIFQDAKTAHLQKQTEKIQKIEEAEVKANEKEQAPKEEGKSEDADVAEKSKNAREKERQKAERLAKREAAEQEVDRIFEAAHAIFYSEKKETARQENNRVQRLLKRYVKNSDKLDDQMKVKLLSRVIEINSTADLVREAQRFKEELRGREYQNDLAAANKRLHAVIKSGQQKGKKAVLAGEAEQQSLKWYQEFFSLPKKEKGKTESDRALLAWKKADDYVNKGIQEEIAKVSEDIERLENNELSELFNLPAELNEKRRIAMEASRYWSGNMKPEEITKLADSIEQTVKDGKSEFKARKDAESAKLLADRAKVTQGIQGVKPVVPTESPVPPKEMNAAGQVLNSMRRNESALWDKILQDTHPNERDPIANDILSVTKAENKEHEIVRRASEDLQNRYVKAVGSQAELRRLVRDGANPKQRIALTYSDILGAPQTKHHTVNELVYLHMAMEDPSAVPGLMHGNKFTLEGMVEVGETSTQEAVRTFLENHEDGKYLKLAKVLQEHYQWFSPLVGNHYLKEYGVALPMEAKYSGKLMHRQLEQIKSMGDLLENVHDFAQRSLAPGSTSVRSGSKRPVVLVDPFKQVQSHHSEMAFWIANSEKARQLSFIFSDSSENGIRDVIRHKLSNEMLNLVDGRLAFQFHLKPGIMDIADRPLQDLRGRFSVSILGGIRPDQRAKQLTAIFAPLKTNTFEQWSSGLKKALTDKEAVAEYLQHSELYRERQGEVVQEMMAVTKDRDFLARITGDREVEANKFFMRDMKFGDGLASKIGGFIEYNRLREAGATPEEAALGADRMVDQTQSSSRMGQKTPKEMKKGTAALDAAFQKEGVQAFNRQLGAVRDAFIHGDAESIKRAARVWFSIAAAQTIFELINNIPAYTVGDDDAKTQANIRVGAAAMVGGLTRIPGFGWDMVTIAQGREPRTMSGAIAGDASKFFKRMWKFAKAAATGEEVEIDAKDTWNVLKAMMLVQGWWTGIPMYPLAKYGEFGSEVAKKAQGEESVE